jgi:riboflavin synthase
MFTGIIEEVGKVVAIRPAAAGARLVVAADKVLAGIRIGDSISTDGVCLTITALSGGAFEADCSAETLRRTTVGRLREGVPVNLERALALGERLGGHLVQGHVEGTGELLARRSEGDSVMMRFSYPPELGRYIIDKGSIAISGVSLTVANLTPSWLEIAVIPATLQWTTLGAMAPGTAVNIETDLIAKYVEKLLGVRAPGVPTVEALKEMGY